jgi:succinate dehydrogenase/fumarate reductase flavoprotein subunit
MESERIVYENYTIDFYRINTLIIGSGAASLNAAVALHSMGQEDILIATSQLDGGTSCNAGSDKQTYYKLSLCGDTPDSAVEMASDLFNGKCMHGDIALCEAQGSVRAFMNLVNLGVRFPVDKYGSWAGYKTDHDPRARATSVGPYTSKRMFEVLSGEVKRRNIRVLDHHHCIVLLTGLKGDKVIGAIAINTDAKDFREAFVLFDSTNIILGTGGPAGIYETSAYPLSQSGSTGMAFRAGATGQNLTESQFGIASVDFRWNLSGSYQQVIPRYISKDKKGGEEKEFLNNYFPDLKTLSKAIFLKGYQWPFDPGKVSNYGSSLIDLLVHREINELNRDVFLDYTANPSWDNPEKLITDDLDPVAASYLANSGALGNTPVERLQALNSPAIDIFKEHGIDLAKDALKIAVCAQHNNGGLKSNIWWESDLSHLFPVGEVNGSHGVYRPGGSALNSGQVGSYRAAEFITRKYNYAPMEKVSFLSEAGGVLSGTLLQAAEWISSGRQQANRRYLSEIRKRMSESAGIIRNRQKISEACDQAEELHHTIAGKIGASSVTELAGSFLLLDHCLTHLVYLESIKTYIENGGRSRGSYIITDDQAGFTQAEPDFFLHPGLCLYDREIEKKILETGCRNGIITHNMVDVREIPKQNLWFEKIWKEYIEDIYMDC